MSDETPKSEPNLAPTWLRYAALASSSLGLAIFVWWTAIASYPNTQTGDGQYFHRLLEAGRVSFSHYRELPLWNPYECGGVPLWDNPQSIVAAPLAWLTWIFGTTWTMKIWYVTHCAAGYACMWILARNELKLSRVASFIAGAAWAYCGFHIHHESGGHAAFVSFQYFPLALYFWRRAEKDLRHAVGLGLVLAMTILEGGVLPLTYLAVLLGVETLTRVWPVKRLIPIARAAGVVLLVALTVGAVRFLPVIDQLRSHTRDFGPDFDALQWSTFRDMFLIRQHPRAVPGQQYVWTEYGTYLGPIVLLFALVGMILGGTETLWIVALLVVSMLIMIGHQGKMAPWAILHEYVYPFKEMRVPSRFRAPTAMSIVMLAAIGFDRAKTWIQKHVERTDWRQACMTALTIVGVLGAADVVSMATMLVIEHASTDRPETNVTPSARLYYGGNDSAPFIDQPKQNRGRIGCYDPWGFGEGAPLWEGDVPQARAIDDGAIVEVANRTQNTFTIDVDVKRPSRIRINSTYDKGWHTDVGTTANQAKELVLDLPAGKYQVHLKYWPKTFTLGLILSILGIAGTVWFFRRENRRRAKAVEALAPLTSPSIPPPSDASNNGGDPSEDKRE
jgi:hypothetical protein